jgi:hypothetical protein
MKFIILLVTSIFIHAFQIFADSQIKPIEPERILPPFQTLHKVEMIPVYENQQIKGYLSTPLESQKQMLVYLNKINSNRAASEKLIKSWVEFLKTVDIIPATDDILKTELTIDAFAANLLSQLSQQHQNYQKLVAIFKKTAPAEEKEKIEEIENFSNQQLETYSLFIKQTKELIKEHLIKPFNQNAQ